MKKFLILALLGLIATVHADEIGLPSYRYEMWDNRYVPTSSFQLCRELEEILNHPINADRETRIPGQMFKIPVGYPNFREIKWEPVPKEEWDKYLAKHMKKDSWAGIYATQLPEDFTQLLEKAYYNADHFEGKQWMVRYYIHYPQYRENDVQKGMRFGGGVATFEDRTHTFGFVSKVPFYFKGRVFNFRSDGSRANGDMSVLEPDVGIDPKKGPYFVTNEVCTFNDNEKKEQ
ncbi:MAG: hypothetical protein OXR68_02930 [Alphaproteobacteria bacterium]|nr:hypothetical protein [Alphaproteobacteria bacterium]MDD9919558.1 hypothetical protein [Alphaproteobacteria bacterium]